MDPVGNPYRPGAGRRPPVLAGRGALLEAFEVLRLRAEDLGEGDQSWVLNGLRGVGKTVLLGELLSRVAEQGWITAKVEASRSTPLSLALSQSLARSLRTATGRHDESRLRRLFGVFESFRLSLDPTGHVSLGVDVAPARGAADTGRLPDDLTVLLEELGRTARELGVGVLILVDELQEADATELDALNSALHALGQIDLPLPVGLIGAGLPSLPALLADATSYAERLFDYRIIGLLDADQSAEALEAPALQRQVRWSPDALASPVATAHGYPYFLQSVGKHVWDNARRSPIDHDDVEVGLQEARREVDDVLYRSRWERATPAQREVLRALAAAASSGPASVGDVARRSGRRRASDISVARALCVRMG